MLLYYLDKYVVGGADFSLNTSIVTFGPDDMGGDAKCFDFDLIQDLILEGDEAFTVAITDFRGAGQGATTSATVTINDNDG